MQVWASVNEADIGRIRLNMPVRFTVDAYPGETFRGKVTQIRMNAQMTQNVVTYTVVVTTDNSDGKLLPYLTANVQFEVDKRSQRAAGAQRGVALDARERTGRSDGRQDRRFRRNPQNLQNTAAFGSSTRTAWSGRWKSRSARPTER